MLHILQLGNTLNHAFIMNEIVTSAKNQFYWNIKIERAVTSEIHVARCRENKLDRHHCSFLLFWRCNEIERFNSFYYFAFRLGCMSKYFISMKSFFSFTYRIKLKIMSVYYNYYSKKCNVPIDILLWLHSIQFEFPRKTFVIL